MISTSVNRYSTPKEILSKDERSDSTYRVDK